MDQEGQVCAGGGVRRARGRWRGTGWRRGGAGRYFRGRPETRSDPTSRNTESALLNDDVASPTAVSEHASAALNHDSSSVDMSGEQIVRSAHAEMDAVGERLKNVNVRGMHPVNRRPRSRHYVVRRSSGRYSRATVGAARDAGPRQPVATEVRTSTVPCGGLDDCVAEDWDAECVPLEPTDNDTPCVESKTDTTEAHTVVSSSGNDDELGTDVNEASGTS